MRRTGMQPITLLAALALALLGGCAPAPRATDAPLPPVARFHTAPDELHALPAPEPAVSIQLDAPPELPWPSFLDDGALRVPLEIRTHEPRVPGLVLHGPGPAHVEILPERARSLDS